jgi:hypothetical protein
MIFFVVIKCYVMLMKLIDLNPRDDLESLAYTLLFLLKGNLPWGTHNEHGTTLGRNAQVRKQKQTWTGSKFVQYCPPEFGQLVDYARGLEFTEHIDYHRILAQFENRQRMATVPPQLQGQISVSVVCVIVTHPLLIF